MFYNIIIIIIVVGVVLLYYDMQSIIFLRRRQRRNVLNKIQIYIWPVIIIIIIIIIENDYCTARGGNWKLLQLTSGLTDCRYMCAQIIYHYTHLIAICIYCVFMCTALQYILYQLFIMLFHITYIGM